IQIPGRLMKEPSRRKVSELITRPPIEAEPGRHEALACKAVPFEPQASTNIISAPLEYLIHINRVIGFFSVQRGVGVVWRQHNEALIRVWPEVIVVVDKADPIAHQNSVVIQFNMRCLYTGAEDAPAIQGLEVATPADFLLIFTDSKDVFPHWKAGRG